MRLHPCAVLCSFLLTGSLGIRRRDTFEAFRGDAATTGRLAVEALRRTPGRQKLQDTGTPSWSITLRTLPCGAGKPTSRLEYIESSSQHCMTTLDGAGNLCIFLGRGARKVAGTTQASRCQWIGVTADAGFDYSDTWTIPVIPKLRGQAPICRYGGRLVWNYFTFVGTLATITGISAFTISPTQVMGKSMTYFDSVIVAFPFEKEGVITATNRYLCIASAINNCVADSIVVACDAQRADITGKSLSTCSACACGPVCFRSPMSGGTTRPILLGRRMNASHLTGLCRWSDTPWSILAGECRNMVVSLIDVDVRLAREGRHGEHNLLQRSPWRRAVLRLVRPGCQVAWVSVDPSRLTYRRCTNPRTCTPALGGLRIQLKSRGGSFSGGIGSVLYGPYILQRSPWRRAVPRLVWPRCEFARVSVLRQLISFIVTAHSCFAGVPTVLRRLKWAVVDDFEWFTGLCRQLPPGGRPGFCRHWTVMWTSGDVAQAGRRLCDALPAPRFGANLSTSFGRWSADEVWIFRCMLGTSSSMELSLAHVGALFYSCIADFCLVGTTRCVMAPPWGQRSLFTSDGIIARWG